MALNIYLAGPDVFLVSAREVGRRKQELCRSFGFEGLFPLDQEDEAEGDAEKIFRANCALMKRADIGLFNLTPFRGPSADAGTVFELGFLFALNRPVYGYANGARSFADRVGVDVGPIVEQNGRLWDRDGYAVENFGLSDNLMIERAIAESGGTIAVVDEIPAQSGEDVKHVDEPLAAFQAFGSALEALRDRFAEARSMEAEKLRGEAQTW